MLKENLKVYGKSKHLLKYFEQDFLTMPNFATDAIIICPPWGGINVSEYAKRNLDEIMKPKLSDMLNHALKFSPNILLQMPKNTNLQNFVETLLSCEGICPLITVEKILREGKIEQLFIYIGEPRFTGIKNHINQMIFKDLGLEGEKNKYYRKKVKEELRMSPYGVASRVYSQSHHLSEEETGSHHSDPPNDHDIL